MLVILHHISDGEGDEVLSEMLSTSIPMPAMSRGDSSAFLPLLKPAKLMLREVYEHTSGQRDGRRVEEAVDCNQKMENLTAIDISHHSVFITFLA